jgi:hypothetical protein
MLVFCFQDEALGARRLYRSSSSLAMNISFMNPAPLSIQGPRSGSGADQARLHSERRRGAELKRDLRLDAFAAAAGYGDRRRLPPSRLPTRSHACCTQPPMPEGAFARWREKALPRGWRVRGLGH